MQKAKDSVLEGLAQVKGTLEKKFVAIFIHRCWRVQFYEELQEKMGAPLQSGIFKFFCDTQGLLTIL